ncbi:MAG TPA: hypothetical protein VFP44_06835 [Usitatibacter sp.]|nr:hypothetical protein [Usitatibacter sp.]
MLMRKLLLGSMAVATLGLALPAAAHSNVDLYLNFGPPPPPVVEYVPAPRVGWVWVPGVWEWRGHRHHWARGHWERARHGYSYAPARWARYGDRWGYHRGGWRRDSDHDGVPDRFDARPFNPYRY